MTESFSFRPDLWPALVSLALAIYLGQYTWRRRRIPGATAFACACALGAMWILGVIFEIAATEPSSRFFWHKFQGVWISPVGVAVTSFIFQFAGLGRWLSVRVIALLCLVPLLNALAIATNDFHHLVWTGFEVRGPLTPHPGPAFWFFNGYIQLLGVLNLAVLGWLAFRSPRHRLPVVIILSGQIGGRIALTLDGMEPGWLGPGELILFALGIPGAAYAIAFVGFHFIDPVTVARTSVLRQMREGMLVLDLKGRILDVNPTGAAILRIPEADLRHRFVAEFPELAAGMARDADDAETTRTEIVLAEPGPTRYYGMDVTTLKGRGDEPVGRLLLLYDLTEERRAQARLLEQREVVATLRERERLARELHDGIGQVLGYVAMQAQTALRWMRSGDGERTGATLNRLAEVAQDAHTDVRESILGLKADDARGWSFLQTLGRYLERFQASYGVRTEISIADGIGEDTFEPAVGVQLMRIIQEALSNSRRHGSAGNVRVGIDRTDGQVHITVADDGRGFDPSANDAERDGHFGLTFMRDRVQEIGGVIRIDSRPGAGTTLTLEVPAEERERS